MDELYARPAKRATLDLNIVPIIDMFTAVIVFLVLSTSFVAFTKLTVPPSRVSEITEPLAKPPLTPKLVLIEENQGIRMALYWSGTDPGSASEYVANAGKPGSLLYVSLTRAVSKAAKTLTSDFNKKFPTERNLQISLSPSVEYQYLIAAMDGARDYMPDIILSSYDEANYRARTPGASP